MTDDAPMTAEARQALLDLVDRAWTLPNVAQVQVLFRYRAHADVTVFTHEHQVGELVTDADARTLLISLGAERGRLYWSETTDEATGVMRWIAHAGSGSSVRAAVQYAITDPVPA